MFGFGKKKEKEKKKSSIDKLIMGAIIGGAVGSVVGMSIAPKPGKETREIITQKGKDLYQKGMDIRNKIQQEAEEKAPEPKGFLAKLKNKFSRKGKKNINRKALSEQDIRKIPNEVE